MLAFCCIQLFLIDIAIITGKEERTREVIFDALKNVQKIFADEGLIANLRLETYEGKNYFHLPPPIDE
jgi:hypothetical protein